MAGRTSFTCPDMGTNGTFASPLRRTSILYGYRRYKLTFAPGPRPYPAAFRTEAPLLRAKSSAVVRTEHTAGAWRGGATGSLRLVRRSQSGYARMTRVNIRSILLSAVSL